MLKINKKVTNFINNKLVILITIILLLLFWWGGALIKNPNGSFSVISYSYDFKGNSDKPLIKGEKIRGEFKSRDNFLGIVYLKFRDFAKVSFENEDVLSFRIKEKGQKDWYYYNNYRTGQIKSSLFFPFGFPVINDSKNHTYIFEVESLFGNNQNSIKLSNKHALSSAHQYPHQEIFGSKKRIIDYVVNKTINTIQNIDLFLSSLIFALPLFVYILWLVLIRKYMKAQYLLILSVPVLIGLDIFLIKPVYNGLLIAFIILSIFIFRKNKLDSSFSFTIFFVLVVIWCVLNFMHINDFINKLNIWAFTFLAIGIMQAILEERKK